MITPIHGTQIRSRDLTLSIWHAHIAARQTSHLTVTDPVREVATPVDSHRRISLAPMSIANWLAHLSGLNRRSA